MRQLLASPEAMNALAMRCERDWRPLDEELSSYELDALLKSAFSGSIGRDSHRSGTTGQARGSPCVSLCQAARRLLKATAISLETRHHGFLAIRFTPTRYRFPSSAASYFQLSQAMQLLAQAAREDLTGDAVEGARMASQARTLFQRLRADVGTHVGPMEPDTFRSTRWRERAMVSGRRWNKHVCAAAAGGFSPAGAGHLGSNCAHSLSSSSESRRYPWIAAQELVTGKNLRRHAGRLRVAGRTLAKMALHLAEANGYRLLSARSRMTKIADAQNAGDGETSERLILATFRELITADPPPIRVVNIIGPLAYTEARLTPCTHGRA